MKVKLTPRATKEFERAVRWWLDHPGGVPPIVGDMKRAKARLAKVPSALFPAGATSQLGPMLLPNWAAVATPLPTAPRADLKRATMVSMSPNYLRSIASYWTRWRWIRSWSSVSRVVSRLSDSDRVRRIDVPLVATWSIVVIRPFIAPTRPVGGSFTNSAETDEGDALSAAESFALSSCSRPSFVEERPMLASVVYFPLVPGTADESARPSTGVARSGTMRP